MNLDTGKIERFETDEGLRKALEEQMNMIEINEKDMTPKQAKTMLVNPHDTRSVLGRKFSSARKARKAARKSV